MRSRIAGILVAAGATVLASSAAFAGVTATAVAAVAETASYSGSGDIADDPAIWVNKADPAASVVIGTNKATSGGGLAVFDLSGRILQFRADGKMNNVDLRDGTVGGAATTVVVSSNRTSKSLSIYKLDPVTRRLVPFAARTVTTGFEPYGLCMYRSPATRKLHVFATDRNSGRVGQFELFESAGKLDGKLVRTLDVSSLAEGCVADDEQSQVYIGRESTGVYKFAAEPTAGSSRVSVPSSGSSNLTPDVEGMALAKAADGTGYLVVSSQGNSSYNIFERQGGNKYLKQFKVAGSGTVDAVSNTDGLDLTTASLGSQFPGGLLVVHDGSNSGGTTSNFKYIDLRSVLTLGS